MVGAGKYVGNVWVSTNGAAGVGPGVMSGGGVDHDRDNPPSSAVHLAATVTRPERAHRPSCDEHDDSVPSSRLTRTAKLLVVDDEPQIGNTLRLLLQPECEVSPMTSARAAVARIAQGDRFDVIFCDLMMPDMSGMQFHASLMQIAPDQADAVVFMTGGVYLESSRAFLDRISNRCIDKPFDLPELRELIASRVH